jgi:HTH-type transcriptional regulator/antitoxin HigA
MTETGGKMIVIAEIDPRKYAKLLSKSLPSVIETEEENQRALAQVDELMSRKKLTPEEEKLLNLLVTLIENFEDRHYPLNASTPHGILIELMEAKNIRQKDLIPIFGSRGRVSEAVNGKREISKVQARNLAEFFRVSVELFI